MIQKNLVAFKVDDELKEKVEKYSKKTHRSVSGTIKYALDRLLVDEEVKDGPNSK